MMISKAKSWNPPGLSAAAVALALILTGLLPSSAAWVNFLRDDTTGLLDELLLGASLFRASLIILGLLILALARLPIWETEAAIVKKRATSSSKMVLILLSLLLLISFGLRLYKLNEGLWLDEIFTFMDYARLPLGEVVSTYLSENQHILFSVLARISFVVFGESAWALRLPAVLFGVGSIWALYLFGRDVSDEREAILASALLAFSYHHVWFSQNARGYTGLLFWTILASWLLLRALRESRAQLWLAYAAAAALGMYTHLTMMFVIFSHFVIYILTLIGRRRRPWPQRWWGLFLGFGGAGFLTFLLYALVLPQMLAAAEVSVVAEWKNPLWTLLEFVNGIQVGFSGGMVALGGIVVVIAGLVFVTGLFGYWRTNRNVVYLLMIPSLVGATITVALGHHLWPRFFFFSFGFAALTVIHGLMLLVDWVGERLQISAGRRVWLGTAACGVVILVSAASTTFAFGPKQDFEGALAYVESQKEPGDAIVTTSLAAKIYGRFYQVDWQVAETENELNAVRAQAQRTWVLYTFPPVLQSLNPGVMALIQRDFQIAKSFPGSVRAGTVFVGIAEDGS